MSVTTLSTKDGKILMEDFNFDKIEFTDADGGSIISLYADDEKFEFFNPHPKAEDMDYMTKEKAREILAKEPFTHEEMILMDDIAAYYSSDFDEESEFDDTGLFPQDE